MSVEVNAVGMQCGAKAGGLNCTYCYQIPVRREEERPAFIDHVRIQLQVKQAAGPDGFLVFGGEPLLAPIEDLQKLWEFGFERYGKNGVQTSGRPITEKHLELFARYKVHVGFSIDGPEELNDARRAGDIPATRAASAHSERMLQRCLEDGIGCSLIVTLHRLNAGPDRLPRLLDWLDSLDVYGLRDARLHLLEVDGPGGKALGLTSEENVAALLAIHGLEAQLKHLRFDIFNDLRIKLLNPDNAATCVWNDCDPWTTPAVHGINADGSRGLCQRVHKDGAQWLPAESSAPRVRQHVLWATPQDDGGCHGCRFFLQCGGQCPGTAIGGDWRNRSADCPTWYALLEHVEGQLIKEGLTPASLEPGLEARIEQRLSGQAFANWHGDAPHGDEHGDHTDAG